MRGVGGKDREKERKLVFLFFLKSIHKYDFSHYCEYGCGERKA